MVNWIKKYPKQADVCLLVTGFALGANLFAFFKISGLSELGLSIQSMPYKFYWHLPTTSGVVTGILFSLWEYRVYLSYQGKLPYYQAILVRLTALAFSIIMGVGLVLLVSGMLFSGYSSQQAWQYTYQFLRSPIFLPLCIYMVLFGVAINFVRALGNRFGHGILLNYIIGKYRQPVEEERIFMFIDLNGSTTLAESLGHTKYSRLLNKCFHDLSGLLSRYDAEIYQYVGDEAVVTWGMRQLSNYTVTAKLFFDFEALLQKNQADYIEKFGVIPSFKASINAGKVTVSEVGSAQGALAYHGDVLNTGARVLGLCSQLKKRLLTTAVLIEAFQKEADIQVSFVSELVLRGKNDKVSVYELAEQK